jgi:dolichol-phosphate mannosyltransferase
MKLSIIVPVFNEEKTIKHILDRLQNFTLPGVKKEIIIVDDGSTDKTAKILALVLRSKNDFLSISHKKNLGKGSAIRSGIQKASGDYILIQDADLEYDPSYIPRLLTPLIDKKADVVYGTRLKRLPNITKEERTIQFLTHYIGNRFLSFLVSLLYRTWLTDIETGYKVFPSQFMKTIPLSSKGFEIEAEITVQLLKNGYTIVEVPITTNPRGYEEGKKLKTIPDGIKAVKMIVKHTFIKQWKYLSKNTRLFFLCF